MRAAVTTDGVAATSRARVVASRSGVVFAILAQCSHRDSRSYLPSGIIREAIITVEVLGMRAVAATLLARVWKRSLVA